MDRCPHCNSMVKQSGPAADEVEYSCGTRGSAWNKRTMQSSQCAAIGALGIDGQEVEEVAKKLRDNHGR